MKIILIFLWLLTSCSKPIPIISPVETFEISVVGAIKEPTTLTIPAFSMIKDVLLMIELLEDSDISSLNPMTILHHHDVLTIPFKTEEPCVNINTDSIKQLTRLVGVGEVIASKIIEYRTQVGLFQHIQHLTRVKGIGDKIFQQNQHQLCL